MTFDPFFDILSRMGSNPFQYLHHFLEVFIIHFATPNVIYPLFSSVGRPQTSFLHGNIQTTQRNGPCWKEIGELVILAALTQPSAVFSTHSVSSYLSTHALMALLLQDLPIDVSMTSFTTPYSSFSSFPQAS